MACGIREIMWPAESGNLEGICGLIYSAHRRKRDKVNGKFQKAIVSFDLYSLAQKEDKERDNGEEDIGNNVTPRSLWFG